MTRFAAWPALLDSFLTRNQHRSFRYGQWDCCLFVCDAIEAMTGTDPAARFRGRYHSLAGARKAIQDATGSKSLRAIVEHITASLGMPEIPVLLATRGDVVLIPRRTDYLLGIVGLNGRDIMTVSPRGLWRIPLSMGYRAWRV
jgi:hypothetical protein